MHNSLAARKRPLQKKLREKQNPKGHLIHATHPPWAASAPKPRVSRGRKPKLTHHQRQEAVARPGRGIHCRIPKAAAMADGRKHGSPAKAP